MLTKVAVSFFTEIEKSVLKFIWKHHRPWTVKAVLSKKSNAGGITVPEFKLHYWVTGTKNSNGIVNKTKQTNKQKTLTWRPME
jgi:hypothetical protein